jgi:putative FmdB family regulatory protein
MPLYETECYDCCARSTIWRRVADRDNLPHCEFCAGDVFRVVSAPYIAPDIASYVSPASGKVINSRVQMSEDLARTGHIMLEPGLKKDIARRRVEVENERFKPIEAAVDAAVNNAVVRGHLES